MSSIKRLSILKNYYNTIGQYSRAPVVIVGDGGGGGAQHSSRQYYHYTNATDLTQVIPDRKPKWMSADEAVSVVKSGDHVFVHSAAATPRLLVQALARHGLDHRLRNIRVHHTHTSGDADYNRPEMADIFRSNSLFTGGNCRQSVCDGRSDYTPVFLSDIPKLFYTGVIGLDVALVSVTPADKHGYHSLGTSVDVARAAVQCAKHVIGQVNQQMPRTSGHAIVHESRFAALVAGDMPLPEYGTKRKTRIELAIGKLIAENLVENGSTIQMGIGNLPDIVLAMLTGHRDLGVHTEMFSDGVVDLCNLGVITNRYKRLQTGRITASFTMGTKKLWDFLDDNPSVTMMSIDYVNNEFNIAQNPMVTAINSCLEVDIVGQVCADSIGTRVYSGFGGQVEFLRGAANALDGKGRPILAMPSITTKGESKIVPYLKLGAGVVSTRAHVHYMVTEYGIGQLFGKNYRQRAYELIRLAHPDYRESLEKAAYERLNCMPSPD